MFSCSLFTCSCFIAPLFCTCLRVLWRPHCLCKNASSVLGQLVLACLCITSTSTYVHLHPCGYRCLSAPFGAGPFLVNTYSLPYMAASLTCKPSNARVISLQPSLCGARQYMLDVCSVCRACLVASRYSEASHFTLHIA